MSENPAANNGNANNRKTSNNNNFFRMRHRFQSNRNTGPKQRTVSLLIPQPSSPRPSTSSSESTSGYPSSSSSGPTVATTSFQISKKNGPYAGWQLYFPDVGMFLVRISN